MSTIPPINIPGTLPEDWPALLEMIRSMLPDTVDVSQLVITSNGDLVNYLTGEKWTPIYAMRDVIVGWGKVEGANPAETTDLAIRPITDLIPVTGGSAVKDIVSGKGAFGMVKNTVIIASLMAIFVSTLTPATSLDSVKEDLLFVLTPFTVDGTNVLVYIDENGRTHISEDVMNAIREALVNMGTYAGEAEIDEPTGFLRTFNYPYNGLDNFSYEVTRQGVTTTWTVEFRNNSAPVHFIPIKASASSVRVILASTEDFESRRTSGDDGQPTAWVSADNSNTYVAQQTTSANSKSFYHKSYDVYPGNFTGMPSVSNLLSNGLICDQIKASNWTPTGSSGFSGDLCMAAVLAYGVEEGGGIAGIDVTGKSDFGDLSKTLEDAIQGLADRYITIANPNDNDIFNKDKWYELNLNSDDVWTDGLTSDQTDPVTNTQGESDDNTKDEIIEKLLEIIQDITGDTDLPDVPVGDSGDTPPAEPPVLNGSSNGLWAIYNPTKAEVQAFGAWLWSSNIIDQIVRQFNSPIDAIIGFHQIYCTPITGSPKVIKAGFLDSPVSAKEVTNQYATINCGQVTVNEYYSTALDYNNSKLTLYLPFVGFVSLDVAVCTGSTLEVIYRIDVFTGTCLAQVKVIKDNSNAVMYTFPGNCAVQIPLTATTYTGMVGALINGAGAVGSFLSGNLMGTVRNGANALASGLTNLTGTQQSGSLGSNAGALGIRIPYLIITHPVAYDAAAYSTQYGYPLNKTVSLGSLSGYTKIKNIHLSGIPCTDDELELIEKLLKDGVIIN